MATAERIIAALVAIVVKVGVLARAELLRHHQLTFVSRLCAC